MKTITMALSIFVLTLSSMAFGGSYAEIQAFLKELALNNTETSVFDLGLSDSGDIIQGVKIGRGPIHQLVVATHHGNEFGSTEVAKAFATDFAKTQNEGYTMYVIPVLNISGYEANERRESAKGTTFDPNRDYPGPCGTEGPYNLKSTKALADFIDKENIIASATLHTFTPVVAYPWGISTHDTQTPFDYIFIQMAKAAVVESGYNIGNSTLAIYPADGAFEDYAYWKHGIWSMLFELGDTHDPDPAQVAELIRGNVPGLRRMLAVAPMGRASEHDFTGKCDTSLRRFDLHKE